MEFSIYSDLHVDRYDKMPYQSWCRKNDKARIALIAGDICSIKKIMLIKEALLFFAKHFKYVLISLGNHEYNFSQLDKVPNEMEKLIYQLGLKNVFLLHKKTFKHQNVVVIGTTLWSDICQHQKAIEEKWQHKHIQLFTKSPKLSATKRFEIMAQLYLEQKNWLTEKMNQYQKKAHQLVIVTHHAPSLKSINPRFKDDENHYLYASNLEEEILRFEPNLWVHGHTHFHCDYHIGKTHIVANPFGFPGEKTNFMPHYRVVV